MRKKTTEEKVVNAILDKGLADSTFREKFPDAYDELLFYRADMEADAGRVIRRDFKAALKRG